jgi:hypothetical protein
MRTGSSTKALGLSQSVLFAVTHVSRLRVVALYGGALGRRMTAGVGTTMMGSGALLQAWSGSSSA